MANVARIDGFTVVGTNGSPGAMPASVLCYVPSTDNVALAKGDLVKLAGSASTDGYPVVTQLAAGSAGTGQQPCGVVTGIKPLLNTLYNNYRLASTAQYVWVCMDPNVVIEGNIRGAHSTADVATLVGQNFNVYVGTISTVFGTSAMEADSGDISSSAAATLPLKCVGVSHQPNNNIGDGAGMRGRFHLNAHQLGSVGTIGV